MANKTFNLEGHVISSMDPLYEYVPGKKIISDHADQIVEYLKENDNNTAYIKISSPGGNVNEAKTIVAKLQPYQNRISYELVGYTASAATYIPMASGASIFMREGSELLIHEAAVRFMPNLSLRVDDLKKEIEDLETINKNLVDVIASRSKLNKTQARAALKQEKKYNAEEALEAGLVDEILEPNDRTKEAHDTYSKEYNNFSKVYLNSTKELLDSKVKEETNPQEDLLMDNDTKVVDEKEKEAAEEIQKHVSGDVKTQSQKDMTIDLLQKDLAKANAQIEELIKEKKAFFSKENERAVTYALERGAILNSEKDYYENLFEKADENSAKTLREYLADKPANDLFSGVTVPYSTNDISSIPAKRQEELRARGMNDDQIVEFESMRVAFFGEAN